MFVLVHNIILFISNDKIIIIKRLNNFSSTARFYTKVNV